MAPKHMACPIGREGYYGFVCTPRHEALALAGRLGVRSRPATAAG